MSADNYIAILTTPTADGTGFEYRVTVLQDSDTYGMGGFAAKYQAGDRSQSMIEEAQLLWEGTGLFKDLDAAFAYAGEYENTHVVEYGIQEFQLPQVYPPCSDCNKTHPDRMGRCECGACCYKHSKSMHDPDYPIFKCLKCKKTFFWD